MPLVSEHKPTFWQIVQSVFAAFFGVQSDKARERDFTHGNAWVFIFAGLIGVTLFVLAVYGVVCIVLANSR